MDAYPPDSLAHNYPLIVLSGLSPPTSSSRLDDPAAQEPNLDDESPQITSQLPIVTSRSAKQLRDYFLQEAVSDSAYNGRSESRSAGSTAFRIKVVGRPAVFSRLEWLTNVKTYRLPARKASLDRILSLASPDSTDLSSSHTYVLHSPLSPLSPTSPVFPDGFITYNWVTKHQNIVPSAFISFSTLTADPNLSSLHDNQLKSEINRTKQFFAGFSTRTRYVVVLLSEASVLEDPEIDDRLSNIRRATGLDPKTSLFFLPSNSSLVELRAFTHTILSTLQPLCIEYYRDLSKHARRKRNRGAIPNPTVPPFRGTSQTLSSQGWSVRYDFKLGVFAEFRQEMEAAVRHYEGAYDLLLSQDVFESIAGWSPRWNEARLLADILCIRTLRCLLWNNQTTSAVRRWQLHRARIRDLVDRRGKGSKNYGWEAWEARWANVMAELLQETSVSAFKISEAAEDSGGTDYAIYVNPEKAVPVGERLFPWQYLHHPGYWFKLMTEHLYARQKFAEAIPEEDRTSLGQSPASQVANKSYLYDTYLCPEPHMEAPLLGHKGVNHYQLITDGLKMAIHEFSIRNQKRSVEHLKLGLAKAQMRNRQWADATHNLRLLWQNMSWRREGWWHMVQDVCWALRTCAQHTGDGGSIVSVEWELHNKLFRPRPDWKYDLPNCLSDLQNITLRPTVTLRSGGVASFLSATYAFKSAEGNVGEQLASQLVISSCAHLGSSPVTLAEVKIIYEGVLRSVILKNKNPMSESTTTTDLTQYMSIQLRGSSSVEPTQTIDSQATAEKPALVGEADLTFLSGQTKIFTFSCLLREAGDVRAKSVILSVVNDLFEVDYVVPLEGKSQSGGWWVRSVEGVQKQKFGKNLASFAKVLPKPPKMHLSLLMTESQYYVGERIIGTVEVLNKEDEETEGSIDIRILGDFNETPELTWSNRSDQARTEEGETGRVGMSEAVDILPGHRIGKLDPSATAKETFSFLAMPRPVEYVLEVKVHYYQSSDPDTPVSKTLTRALTAIAPWEASYDFSPQVHPGRWPNYFQMHKEVVSASPDTSTETAQGLLQKWCLMANLGRLADDNLVVENATLRILATNGGIVCSIVEAPDKASFSSFTFAAGSQQIRFVLEVQKLTLEDRRSAALDLALDIEWSRSKPDSEVVFTRLDIPRLLVAGGEPRILASVQYSSTVPGLIHLDYTIENPSMHLLTFSLVMDTSDDFAFHGPKISSPQLVPLSRHVVHFNLFPTVRGKWVQPQLRVVDRYFNNSLKISATEGLKMDKKGISVWVKAEDNV